MNEKFSLGKNIHDTTYKHGENKAFQIKIWRRDLTMEWRVNNKRDLQHNSTTTEKDTNVTTVTTANKNPRRAIVLVVLQIPACKSTLGTQNCHISIKQLDMSLPPLYLNRVRKWNKFSHHVLRAATKGHIKVGRQCMTNSDFLWGKDVLCTFHIKPSWLNTIKKWNKSFPIMEWKSSLNCRRSKENFILSSFNRFCSTDLEVLKQLGFYSNKCGEM